MENGIRAVFFGSNPHSNGDDFSRSTIDRAAKIHAANSTTVGNMIQIRVEAVDRFIN